MPQAAYPAPTQTLSPLPLDRTRQGWPGNAARHDPDTAKNAEIARRFETMIAQTLLRSARAASLGDDGLGPGGANIRDMVDNSRAEAIARAAPLGVARLLAAQGHR